MVSRYCCSLALVACLCIPCKSVTSAAPPFYPDKTRLLVYRDDQGREMLITQAAQWAIRRAHILANMQEVMGPLPDASQKVPLDVRVSEEIRTERYVRKKLTYAVEKADHVPAYLLVPSER